VVGLAAAGAAGFFGVRRYRRHRRSLLCESLKQHTDALIDEDELGEAGALAATSHLGSVNAMRGDPNSTCLLGGSVSSSAPNSMKPSGQAALTRAPAAGPCKDLNV
jgi:hypothetical protein